jgi:hypothetical protein
MNFTQNTGPRNVNTEIKAIVKAKIALNCNYIAAKDSDEKSAYEVNNIMCSLITCMLSTQNLLLTQSVFL